MTVNILECASVGYSQKADLPNGIRDENYNNTHHIGFLFLRKCAAFSWRSSIANLWSIYAISLSLPTQGVWFAVLESVDMRKSYKLIRK